MSENKKPRSENRADPAERFPEIDLTLPRPIASLSRLITLPPLAPSLILVCFILYGGITSGPGSWYMPILFEGWFFFLGMVAWGGANLVCLPVTMLLHSRFPSYVVGLFYSLFVSAAASAVVSWQGWLVDRLEMDEKVLYVATLPMFLTTLVCFHLLSRRPSKGGIPFLGQDTKRHLLAIISLIALTGCICLLVIMKRDIEKQADEYYWQYQPQMAEVIDGNPVLSNFLFRWIDTPPTAASTEDRAWLFGEASLSYQLEPLWGRATLMFLIALMPMLFAWRREEPGQ